MLAGLLRGRDAQALRFGCTARAVLYSCNTRNKAAIYSPLPLPAPCLRYGASYWRLFRANLQRSWRLQMRSSLFMYVRVFQVLLMAFVVATTYINVGKTSLDDGERAAATPAFALLSLRQAL